jgi:hypothetical protein
MGEKWIQVLVGNLKERPFGRPRCRWEIIKMDLERNMMGRLDLSSS